MPKRRIYVRDWHGRFSTVAAAKQANKVIEAHETPPQPNDDNQPKFIKDRDIQAEQTRINELQKQGLNPDMKGPLTTGKNVLLYHRTTPERAEAIVKEGFRSDKGASTVAGATSEKGNAFFVPYQSVENWKGYGEAVVSVVVPRRDVQKDETMATYYPQPTKVPVNKLKGRKFKREK